MRPAGHAYHALNRAIGKALHAYDMIRDGDRILVGLSGGSDSLALLWMLAERRRRVRVRFELAAAHIDLGFADRAGLGLEEFCRQLGVPLRVEMTDFGVQGHSPSNRENPCFLCARLRRQRLFEVADGLGCATLALGHTQDDLIETLFINMLYAGEISSMRPAQPLFGGRFTIIRPLAHAGKALIDRFVREQRLPAVANPCPTSRSSRRQSVRRMLRELYGENPNIRGNIFRALHHVKTDYLLK
ncbi:MAG: tRNA 2-thiocytidine(32) synthetase TtcA [Desulfobacterales bacterium]|nr:tRNA 2-thiocytidine(32) synthetase TtcA [Desulfobacterales bacterium]